MASSTDWHLPLVHRMRTPLSSSTNSPPSPTAPPIEPPVLQRQLIRRKASLSYGKKDSSEEIPSSNGSGIYNAHAYSNSDSHESAGRAENLPASDQAVDDHGPNWESFESRENNESRNGDEKYSTRQVEFLYGQGTRLETISEKNSNSTMQSLSHRKSTGALSSTTLSSFPALSHEDSLELSRIRRKKSLSLDITMPHHYYGSLIAAEPDNDSFQVYTQPMEPLLPPPERSSTPPNMPSFTLNQQRNVPARTSSAGPRRSVMDFLTVPSLLTGRTTAAEIGHHRNMPPRYTPPRSGYSAFDNHPYNRCSQSKAPKNKLIPSLGGITVVFTFGTEVIAQPPELPTSALPKRTKTVKFAPSVVGGSEVTTRSGVSRSSSTRNPRTQQEPSSSRRPRPKSEADLFDAHNDAAFSGASFRSNHTSVTAAPAPGHNQSSALGDWFNRRGVENSTNSRSHASEQARSYRHSAPPPSRNVPSAPRNTLTAAEFLRSTAPPSARSIHSVHNVPSRQRPAINPSIHTVGQSRANSSPLSPSVSQVNLVPVTNLEKKRQSQQEGKKFCRWKCFTKRRLSKIGRWIDRTGERMENGLDRASKGLCLLCCGIAEADDDGESYRSGMRGGQGRENLNSRWVKLKDLTATN